MRVCACICKKTKKKKQHKDKDTNTCRHEVNISDYYHHIMYYMLQKSGGVFINHSCQNKAQGAPAKHFLFNSEKTTTHFQFMYLHMHAPILINI